VEKELTVMDAKYHMTREENIFAAKRNIVDYIWKSARLEGLVVTHPDTEAIFNGMSVQGVKVSDIIAVNNLYCLTISHAVIPDYRTLTSYLRMFTIGKIQRSVV